MTHVNRPTDVLLVPRALVDKARTEFDHVCAGVRQQSDDLTWLALSHLDRALRALEAAVPRKDR